MTDVSAPLNVLLALLDGQPDDIAQRDFSAAGLTYAAYAEEWVPWLTRCLAEAEDLPAGATEMPSSPAVRELVARADGVAVARGERAPPRTTD